MKYESNAISVINKLKAKLLSSKSQDDLLRTCAQSVYASNLRRIHNEGKNVSGSPIGKYSTKPLYINPKNSPKKFQPKGKKGNSSFNNGKPHKTKYFVEGYKGFRSSIGQESGKVVIQLSGKLKESWQMQKNPNGFGYVIGFMSKKEANKAKGNEKHFKSEIWGISHEDKKTINLIVKNWVHSNAGTK